MSPPCGRNGCLGRMRWLGQDDGDIYYECKAGHFSRVTVYAQEDVIKEIGGLEIPDTIRLTDTSHVEE